MRALLTCPDVLALQDFLLGHTPDAEAALVEEHLLACDRCALAVNGLVDQDELFQPLRDEGATTQAPVGEAVESLIARLVEYPPPTQPASTETRDQAGSSADIASENYDFLSPPQGPEELGRLGPYRLLNILGIGGMGLVFQAEDTQLQRRVALKVVKPGLATSASARERFHREARTAAVLQHDHIVTIYQEGEDHGVPFLAMQLLEGESLEDRLRRESPLPIAEILRIGGETAEALGAAHARGLIHRDIKPANIWLESGGGRVKILDFGLARAMDTDVNLTQSGVISGTPQYMAPSRRTGLLSMPAAISSAWAACSIAW